MSYAFIYFFFLISGLIPTKYKNMNDESRHVGQGSQNPIENYFKVGWAVKTMKDTRLSAFDVSSLILIVKSSSFVVTESSTFDLYRTTFSIEPGLIFRIIF